MSLNEINSGGRLERMLSTDEVLKILGVSRKTLYRYVKSGSLKCYKFGRDLKFKESDIKAFIEAHEKK
ncbi:MAG: helix-turn-helix domain-containing protein [Actinomycetota bacterium]